jgi:hypothetical protein
MLHGRKALGESSTEPQTNRMPLLLAGQVLRAGNVLRTTRHTRGLVYFSAAFGRLGCWYYSGLYATAASFLCARGSMLLSPAFRASSLCIRSFVPLMSMSTVLTS